MGGQRLITTVRPAPNSETADLHAFDVERLLADCIGAPWRQKAFELMNSQVPNMPSLTFEVLQRHTEGRVETT